MIFWCIINEEKLNFPREVYIILLSSVVLHYVKILSSNNGNTIV